MARRHLRAGTGDRPGAFAPHHKNLLTDPDTQARDPTGPRNPDWPGRDPRRSLAEAVTSIPSLPKLGIGPIRFRTNGPGAHPPGLST